MANTVITVLEADGITETDIMVGSAYFCWTHDNTVATSNHVLFALNAIGCLSYNNLGGGGFGSSAVALNCVSYGNALTASFRRTAVERT